jgi:hypothetical protein
MSTDTAPPIAEETKARAQIALNILSCLWKCRKWRACAYLPRAFADISSFADQQQCYAVKHLETPEKHSEASRKCNR